MEHRPSKRRPKPARPAQRTPPYKPKRSLEGPLWVIGAAVLIGYPLVRDATADKMLRNTYANSSSCHCAYSVAQCNVDGTRWLGPWYARDAEDRQADDPGPGKDCQRRGYHGGSSAYYGGSGRSDDGIGPRTGVETGHRGGFGGSGRVRAGG
jgi:hypothetical protein